MLRRFGPLGLVVVGVLILALLAASLLFPSRPSRPAVPWGLATDSRRPIAAQTTVVLIRTQWWPGCSPWGDLGRDTSDDSWLTPDITYAPRSVTVTLHESDLFVAARCGSGPGLGYDYWGIPVEIHLKEPLAGRALFDGSTFPPGARPYP